jgi:hypothetical protein
MGMLLAATRQPGEPYDDLDQLYGRLLGQWVREMNHVAAVVGGVNSRQKATDQDGLRFVPISAARQRAAARFLNDHAFATPTFLINPDILGRIEADGVLARLKASQKTVLTSLMAESRITRLAEQEARAPQTAYRPADFMVDVARGIWSELSLRAVQIDAYRRNLQRAYLEVVDDKLNGRQPATTDGRPLARAQLRTIDAQARLALARAVDRTTRAHLQDVRDQIARILDPRGGTAPRPPALRPGILTQALDAPEPGQGCWVDFAITAGAHERQ